VDLTKYVAQTPPNSPRDLVRYLDSEIRKIQRALDSVIAWKTALESGDSEELRLRFLEVRGSDTGVDAWANFLSVINLASGADRKSGIRLQVGDPSTWLVGIWTQQGTWYHAFGDASNNVSWGFDGARLKTPSEAWIAPTLQNSWVNYGSPFAVAGYMKDVTGRVHLKGLVKDGTISYPAPIFTLPVGFRPAAHLHFAVSGSDAAESGDRFNNVVVLSTGEVAAAGPESTGAFVSLSNIHFLAEG
jgi:hypothetical protein